MIVNRIPECLFDSERRPLDIDRIRYLVVHRIDLHRKGSDNPHPIPDAELDGPWLTAWHRTQPTIGRCAYHFLIKTDGTIEQLLPLSQRGAHAIGLNGRSIAVALVGDFREITPRTEQLAALLTLGNALLPLCREMIGHTDTPGHSKDPGKVCPGNRIALPLVAMAIRGRLPDGWAEWTKERCADWARENGAVV